MLTWPWLSHPSTHVLSHWDPPFHAWKLAFAARSLLAGHLLPPDGNTNVLYPQSGAFFFEALHWPQAVFAAPLLALGLSPVLVYHVTLVFFWALSGVAFRFWLRTLSIRDPFAALGGLFFVLVPYRMSYAVEFNMQLCFALPLLLGAMVLFFRRPGFGPALLAAVAWWFQAVSELYQAVFVVVVLPFFVLPFFARNPGLLRSARRFWGPMLAAAAVCCALSLPFLLPYARTLGDGTLVRTADEMGTHALEPFSYVFPYAHRHFLPIPYARRDEMSVYPTLALAAAAVFGWFVHRRAPKLANLLFGIGVVLAAVAAVALHFAKPPAAESLASAVVWMGTAAVVAAVPCLLRPDRSVARAAAAGIGAAALPALLLSFGPVFFDSAAGVSVDNPFFNFCAPVLGGFRVISRFAVFPTLALCTAAAVGLSDAASALSRRRVPRAVQVALLVLFFAAFAVECIPPKIHLRPIRDVSNSTAIAAFDALPGPKVLAIVPMGDRSLDSEHMLTIARHDRLSAWAWAGTFPRFSRHLRDALIPGSGNPDTAVACLSQLWPDACVLEDRRRFRRHDSWDYAEFFGARAEVLAEDPEFRLFRVLPDSWPGSEAVRIVRRDFAAANSRAVFTLSAPASARVWLDLNNVPLGVFDATPEAAGHVIDVPGGLFVSRRPQVYRFHAEDDAVFTLSGFRLEAAPSSGEAPTSDFKSLPDLPWLPVSSELPPSAIPLDVRYPRGISLCGVSALSLEPAKGEFDLPALRFRLYFRFPADVAAAPRLVLAPGYAKDGAIIYKNLIPCHAAIEPSAIAFAAGRIVAADISLPVIGHLSEGETYGISFDLMTPSGHRLHPCVEGKRQRHLFLPLAHTVSRSP